MAISLKIHLFGPFEILRDGRAITNQEWRSSQTRTICKYLAARRGQVVSSDQLLEMLWPGEAPEAARRRLHVRISQLRRALGPDKSLLQTVDEGYLFHLDENCWVDVDQFQAALTQGGRFQEAGQLPDAVEAYEKARALYRGDFLAEDCYVDWTFPSREFYRERFLTLLVELAECCARQGRYRRAVERCQQALERDPLRETIYVRLMLYHYYAGERAQALRMYDRCCQVLAGELEVQPLESTVRLAEQIQSGSLLAGPGERQYPPPIYEGRLYQIPYALSEAPFTGREREYAWLVDQWQAEEARVLLLEGEAGIGKSRLVHVFTGYIASQGAVVLRARIAPAESSPYSPVITALRPLIEPETLAALPPATRAVLAALFPEIPGMFAGLPRLPELPPEGERQRLHAALDQLAAACLPPQTLLVVDDAHRIAAPACEILARMTASLKVLLSFRHEETPAGHPIRQIFQTPQNARRTASLRLEALSSTAIQSLLQELARSDLAQVGTQIRRQAAGNPLYLVALLQHMFESGQLYIAPDGAWRSTGDAHLELPPTIRSTVEARLQRLDRPQRSVFDLAAVLGGEFSFDLLQAASRQPEEVLLATLDGLIDLELIVEPRSLERAEFAIVHDRYTEAAYETIPAVRRKQIHLQAAEALEMVYAGRLPVVYPALAGHFGRAGAMEKERHYSALAGEQAAAQYANQAALCYLSRALALTPAQDVLQRSRLLLRREKVSDLLGDRQAQKEDLDALAALLAEVDGRTCAEVYLRQAAYDWILGDDPAARLNLEQAIALAHACRAADIEAASYLLLGRGNLDQALARQQLEKARALARQAGERAMEGDIVRCLGNACFWQNSYVESRAYFEEALAIHREVGDLRGELSALNNLGLLFHVLGDPQSSVRFLEKGLAICHKTGDRLGEGVLLGNLGDLAVQLGDYRQAQTWLEQALAIRDEIENEEGAGMALKRLGDALRRQGQYARAEAYYQRCLEINTRINHPGQQCATLDSLSMLCRELGDYDGAQIFFQRALQVLDDEQAPNRLQALANGCLLYHCLGKNEAALEIGQKARALSAELPLVRAAALTNLGHALAALKRFAEAEQSYQQALALRRELMQPHLALEPAAGLARLALARGDTRQARGFIEEILDHLASGPLQGPDQPLRVYLTAYQVLLACRAPGAPEVLQAAHQCLQDRAASIAGEDRRNRYFEAVEANREIWKLSQAF